MNVLMTYRLQAFKTEIIPQFEKFKNDNITFIVQSKYSKNWLPVLIKRLNLELNINIITAKEFLGGDFKLKFDYIVGNPPYQKTNSDSDAGKLYLDITRKTLTLLKTDGEINFITPTTLAQEKRTGLTLKGMSGLKSIDYTANDKFDVGVEIMAWCLDKKYNGPVTVIDKEGEHIREVGETLVKEEDRIGFELFERIKDNPKNNKLFVGDQSTNGKRQKEKSNEYKYKIIVNKLKDKIEYSRVRPKLFGRKKIAIPMGMTYSCDNFIMSNDDFGQYQNMIDITDFTEKQINNLKSFLFNDITILLCKKYRVTYKTGMNNIIYSFPKINVSKKYTDKDIIQIFDITDEELKWLKN